MATTANNTRNTQKLVAGGRRYWSDQPTKSGRIAGIGWAPDSRSWTRCYAQASKYMGARAKGYCANRMHQAIGIWPGSKANNPGRGH
jgi:hypothetical protein